MPLRPGLCTGAPPYPPLCAAASALPSGDQPLRKMRKSMPGTIRLGTQPLNAEGRQDLSPGRAS